MLCGTALRGEVREHHGNLQNLLGQTGLPNCFAFWRRIVGAAGSQIRFAGAALPGEVRIAAHTEILQSWYSGMQSLQNVQSLW